MTEAPAMAETAIEQPREIVPVEATVQQPTDQLLRALPNEMIDMTDEQLERRLVAIQRAANAKRRMTQAALALCYPHDFIDFGGKPYLEGEGAMRFAGIGILLGEPHFSHEWIGEDCFVTCKMRAEFAFTGQVVFERGTCSTRDKFFAKETQPGSKFNQHLDQCQGDPRLARRMLLGDVEKKAHSNAISRAVTSVAGIRGLQWEDLAALGFTRKKAGAQVDFDKGKGGAGAGAAGHRTNGGASPTAPPPSGPPADETAGPAHAASDIGVDELLQMKIGQECGSVVGVLMGAWGNVKHWKVKLKSTISDAAVFVKVWTTSPMPDFLTRNGITVRAMPIRVKEYMGKADFHADDCQPVATE